jgi:hypothetical protein
MDDDLEFMLHRRRGDVDDLEFMLNRRIGDVEFMWMTARCDVKDL